MSASHYNYSGALFGSYIRTSINESFSIATPAVVREGDTPTLRVFVWLNESVMRYSSLQAIHLVLLPGSENGSSFAEMILSEPVLITPIRKSHVVDFPLPEGLPTGSFCIAILDSAKKRLGSYSNIIEIIPADAKKGIITVDLLAATLKFHPEFTESPPVSFSGQPNTITLHDDDRCADRVYAVRQDGTVFANSGFQIANRIRTQFVNQDDVGMNAWKIFQPLSAFKVISMVCGYDHTLVLTDTGDVFSMGKNEYACTRSWPLPFPAGTHFEYALTTFPGLASSAMVTR